ncbi:hypothetical protein [Propionibacterium freudenreichii]|uniref:hypothetical protein n=1 Tax=Propionibacterium freudenreichii TaxID=1744 RepID=UPI00254AA0C4|nr:hypothetical protein [Propionibacterium freudenreichii]
MLMVGGGVGVEFDGGVGRVMVAIAWCAVVAIVVAVLGVVQSMPWRWRLVYLVSGVNRAPVLAAGFMMVLQRGQGQRVHAVESNSVAVVPAVLVVAVLPPAHASTEIELPDGKDQCSHFAASNPGLPTSVKADIGVKQQATMTGNCQLDELHAASWT